MIFGKFILSLAKNYLMQKTLKNRVTIKMLPKSMKNWYLRSII